MADGYTPDMRAIRDAKRRLFSRIIACAHLLDEPFTDEPRLSRWDLLKRDMTALDRALKGETRDRLLAEHREDT